MCTQICTSDTEKMAFSEPVTSLQIGKVTVATDEVIGKSDCSTVFRGRYEGEIAPVAIKRLTKSNKTVDLQELNRVGSHAHILAVQCLEEDADFYYIVGELCAGNLRDLVLGNYTGPSIDGDRELLSQIALGLDYLHQNGMVHSSMKPENILISQSTNSPKAVVKLADFCLIDLTDGLNAAGALKNNRQDEPITVFDWMAPEVLAHAASRPSPAANIYSAGCIFGYTLSGGRHPFGNDVSRQSRMMRSKLKTKSEHLKRGLGSQEKKLAFDLIQSMLALNASKRPTSNQVLRHPYFNSTTQQSASSPDRHRLDRKPSVLRKIAHQLGNRLSKTKRSFFGDSEKNGTGHSTPNNVPFIQNDDDDDPQELEERRTESPDTAAEGEDVANHEEMQDTTENVVDCDDPPEHEDELDDNPPRTASGVGFDGIEPVAMDSATSSNGRVDRTDGPEFAPSDARPRYPVNEKSKRALKAFYDVDLDLVSGLNVFMDDQPEYVDTSALRKVMKKITKAGVMKNEWLCHLIMAAYALKPVKIDVLLAFVRSLPFIPQIVFGLDALFEATRRSNYHVDNPAILEMHYYAKQLMNMENYGNIDPYYQDKLASLRIELSRASVLVLESWARATTSHLGDCQPMLDAATAYFGAFTMHTDQLVRIVYRTKSMNEKSLREVIQFMSWERLPYLQQQVLAAEALFQEVKHHDQLHTGGAAGGLLASLTYLKTFTDNSAIEQSYKDKLTAVRDEFMEVISQQSRADGLSSDHSSPHFMSGDLAPIYIFLFIFIFFTVVRLLYLLLCYLYESFVFSGLLLLLVILLYNRHKLF